MEPEEDEQPTDSAPQTADETQPPPRSKLRDLRPEKDPMAGGAEASMRPPPNR